MISHSVETWIEIFGKLPSPLTETAEFSMANRIIGDLVGYRHTSKHRQEDVKNLANAMIAYARLLQQHNVTP